MLPVDVNDIGSRYILVDGKLKRCTGVRIKHACSDVFLLAVDLEDRCERVLLITGIDNVGIDGYRFIDPTQQYGNGDALGERISITAAGCCGG